MDSLGPDTLQAVLSHLEWRELLAAGSTCRHLRDATAASSPLWRDLCRQRWARLNTGLFATGGSSGDGRDGFESSGSGVSSGGGDGGRGASNAGSNAGRGGKEVPCQASTAGTDWRGMFMHDNGWARPRLSLQRYAGGQADSQGGKEHAVLSCSMPSCHHQQWSYRLHLAVRAGSPRALLA